MKKDRFVAFFDAIMAIIMTIVVLEFVIPKGTNWQDVKVLGFQVLSYAISFFWLGGMWIYIHNVWHGVDKIDRAVLWSNIAMLFFASMIPFFVVYVGLNVNKLVPQVLYGIDVLMISVFNWISTELLARHHNCVKAQIKSLRLSMEVDLAIKIAGFVVGITVLPMAIIISVLISTVFMIIWRTIVGKRHV